MSMYVALVKPLNGVTMNMSKSESLYKKDYEEIINIIHNSDSLDLDELDSFLSDNTFSDGKNHKYECISFWKELSKYNKRTRLRKKIERIETEVFCKVLNPTNTIFQPYKYFVFDEVYYRQGWFMKNRFYKKPITQYFGLNKSEMIGFLRKYMDFKEKKNVEIFNELVSIYEEGMIFICSF